jgi:hypothetical protein
MLLLLMSVVVLLVLFEEVPPPLGMSIVIRLTAHFHRTPQTGRRPRPSPELLEMNTPLFSQPCITRFMRELTMGSLWSAFTLSIAQSQRQSRVLLRSVQAWAAWKSECDFCTKYKVQKFSTSSLIVFGEKSQKAILNQNFGENSFFPETSRQTTRVPPHVCFLATVLMALYKAVA